MNLMLVLLPGLDGTGTLFAPFVRRLGPRCDVQIVQYPVDAFLSYSQLERYLLENLTSLPANVSITLIAESFSGPIALKISQRKGLNLRAVVLVNSFAAHPLGRFGNILSFLPLSLIFRLPLPPAILRAFFLVSAASPDLISATSAAISSVKSAVLSGRLREALTGNYGNEQIAPQTRIVALFSKQDRLLPKSATRNILRVCSRVEVHVVDAPHLALQSVPDKVITSLISLGVLDQDGCA